MRREHTGCVIIKCGNREIYIYIYIYIYIWKTMTIFMIRCEHAYR